MRLSATMPPAALSQLQRVAQRHLREGEDVRVFILLRPGASAATVEAALATLREFADGLRGEVIEEPKHNMRRCHMLLGPEAPGSAPVGARRSPSPAPVSAGAHARSA